MPVDRQRTPTVFQALGAPRVERWDYVCPCGEIYRWERRVVGVSDASRR